MSSIFSIQLDKSTDITHISQFMVFVRYKVNKSIKEEFIFCDLITTITKSYDVVRTLLFGLSYLVDMFDLLNTVNTSL